MKQYLINLEIQEGKCGQLHYDGTTSDLVGIEARPTKSQ